MHIHKTEYHAAKRRTHTRSRALLATYTYTTRHAATEPGLYTVAQKEGIFFSNNCNFFIINIKKLC